MSNDNVIIEAPNDTTLTIKGGNLVSIKAKDKILDEKILIELFINHYRNIVGKSSGTTPKIYRGLIRSRLSWKENVKEISKL